MLGDQLNIVHAKLVALQIDGLLDQFVDADHLPLFGFLRLKARRFFTRSPWRLASRTIELMEASSAGPPRRRASSARC